MHPGVTGLSLKDEQGSPRKELRRIRRLESGSRERQGDATGRRTYQPDDCGWGLWRRTSERFSSPRRNSTAHVPDSDSDSRQPVLNKVSASFSATSAENHCRQNQDCLCMGAGAWELVMAVSDICACAHL